MGPEVFTVIDEKNTWQAALLSRGLDSWPELQEFLTQFVKGEFEMDFDRDLKLLKLLAELSKIYPRDNPKKYPRMSLGYPS
ncbi:hypothetical protein RHSIM_Rhsim11G0018400 [Rhododendron simsii]|uniref:Uncharacterized protein n=1 Tax=Rhododendron simsii TaxID=118357 RepID=A0A834GB53_RHOSS|nr:hypothetical protein RHSIM_Rhsim11G0018400 [Rhododendron simsii]